MAKCLDVQAWRKATPSEMSQFLKGKSERKGPRGSLLVIRTKLTQVDVYTWLRARFGIPNGFQNLLRTESSDNLVHWDFNLKAGSVDVYIQGRMRDVMVMISEPMKDADWKALILAIQGDFGRVGKEKSQILKGLEKFLVFQNKYVALANVCADLHATISEAPALARKLPRIGKTGTRYKAAMGAVAERATNLYSDCLKLRLMTPVMAEAYLNMVIIIFCKPAIRDDQAAYNAFVRDHIPQRLEKLHTNCVGFSRAVDPAAGNYKGFLRVMNKRNFQIHANVDPVRETVETVYFEGKRPLFAENGNHLLKLFEHLDAIHAPADVLADYEAVHAFLLDIRDMLAPRYREFFDQVINDPYPGYEVKAQRVTRILPDHNASMMFPGEKFDDELKVKW
jgi:hypothetical protein